MKCALAFVAGCVLTASLAWPRVTPEVRYYVDAKTPIYHADRDCAYGHLFTFASRQQAEGARLKPCPQCMSQPQGDKIADRDSHDGQEKTR